MSLSRQLKQVLRREIKARQDLVGTVVEQRRIREFNVSAAPVWVCSVDIGGNRILKNVPIKGGNNGGRSFAERGQAVILRRNTQGRFNIIGPSDRLSAIATVKTYNVGDLTPVATTTEGFNIVIDPFEFYENGAGTSFWNDGVTPFPSVRILDQLGNPA